MSKKVKLTRTADRLTKTFSKWPRTLTEGMELRLGRVTSQLSSTLLCFCLKLVVGGEGNRVKPYFAWEMAEAFIVNIEPYQFEPVASESDDESSHDSSDNNTYDVNEERIGQVDW